MRRTKQLIIFFFFIALILLLGIWIGYQFLDPFNRDIIIAMIPIDLLFLIIGAMLFAVFNTIFHGGSFGFAEGKNVQGKTVNVSFADIIGLEDAVMEAQEVVSIVKDRIKSKLKGSRIIRGLLLLGPPGCGKTLIAKAIATEAGLPFLALSGSDFVEKWYALGAMRVRGLFKEARRLAQKEGACVVFIDEIEVIGRKRSFSANSSGSQETNRTLTQLLVEMDGLNAEERGNIIVIGATNASQDVLDDALLRPGRFDRKLYIDHPSSEGRMELFAYYLAKASHEISFDLEPIARITYGKTPADIENIVREATLTTHETSKHITFDILLDAVEKLDLGLKSHLQISAKEEEVMAFHETGHLMCARHFCPQFDVIKVSITPRRRRFSVVQQIPKDDIYLQDKEYLLSQIKTHLGGYCAEKLQFHSTSELVNEDFAKASKIAEVMVWVLGMGQSGLVGNYQAILRTHISDAFLQRLNDDTEAIIAQCRIEVEDFLRANQEKLHLIAKTLLEKKELHQAHIQQLF